MLTHYPPFTIHHFPSLDSTNDQLKRMAEAPEFTCVTTAQQTAGRGRRDRAWYSAAGEGLYLSLLLRPQIEPHKFPLLSLMTVVAVTESLFSLTRQNHLPLQFDIKWPNDILLNEHKVSGILIESATLPQELPRVIVGIGINVNQPGFPPDLAETATSLLLEGGKEISIETLRNSVLDHFALWYERFRAGRENQILSRWQERSSFAYGKAVTLSLDQEEIQGITDGIDAGGALRLRLPNGTLRTILAGEIKHLRQR